MSCSCSFDFVSVLNQQPGLNIITEYVWGYMYPGFPVANMLFKVYGYISMAQALTFVYDFKLGHYMKIPPRAMFMAQVIRFSCTHAWCGQDWEPKRGWIWLGYECKTLTLL